MSIGRIVANIAAIAAAAGLIAGIVHIIAILVAPIYAQHDAWVRLSSLGPQGATIELPRAGPDARLIPYQDPAVAAAFCRFDLSRGPTLVHASASDDGFSSLSFHTKRGSIF